MAKPKTKTTLPAVKEADAATVVVGNRVFTPVRQVTLPLLKHADNEIVTIRITSAIYEGKQVNAKNGKPKEDEKAADLVRAVNLQTGRPCTYIVSAVVKSTLNDEYPEGDYVNRCFAIHKLPAPTGKRYKSFEIVEIEDNGETV